VTWAVAQISPNASVSPDAIYLGQSVQLYRDGTANFGVAFTDNTVWAPDGSYDALGMMGLGGPTTYTPTMTGTYWYQFRLADIYYNYQDQWISFTVSPQGDNPPTSVTSASVGSTFVTINWSGASAQNGISNYYIYRNGVLIASVPSSASSYPDSTNSPGTTYTYTIATVDSQGNISNQSSPLTVTTLPGLEVFTPVP
jgi:chitodextrinase